jgi:hypothetical protein
VPKWNGSALVSGSIYVDDNDNVGIGTTTPWEPLHVVSDIGADAIHIHQFMGTENWKIGVGFTGNLNFKEDGTVRVAFENGGNVGIGTIDPATALEINGDGSSWSKGFISIKNDNNDAGIRIYNGSTTTHHIFNDNTNADKLRIAPDGSFGSGGITILQNGNVGIHDTTPTTELDVNGDISAYNMPGIENTSVADEYWTWSWYDNAQTITVTIDSPGYVLVTFSGNGYLASGDILYIGIGNVNETQVDTYLVCSGENWDQYPFRVQHVYYENTPGTYTYYGNAKSNNGNCDVRNYIMTAVYVPNRI